MSALDQVAAASGATVQSTSVPGLVEVQGSQYQPGRGVGGDDG